MIEDQESIEDIAMINIIQSTEEDRHLRHPLIQKDIDERSLINVTEIIEDTKVPIKTGDVHDLDHRQGKEEIDLEHLRNIVGSAIRRRIDMMICDLYNY